MFIDSRPSQTSGNYLYINVASTPGGSGATVKDREFYYYTNGVETPTGKLYTATDLLDIKMKFRKDRTEAYINGVQVSLSTNHLNGFIGTSIGIGRHAWSSAGGTIPFKGKVYYFDIRKIS